METLPVFHIKVLQHLAARYGLSCTLEEITRLLAPVINDETVFNGTVSSERAFEATVLDALIVLNDKGHIFLNSVTDKSAITIKGLIAVNSKALCN
ncbi:hypothetical protein [Flavobacterium sp. C3NV]|uniref:hypothetical protein n=1 Tax=Flavobacterium sp. C3NV TaxID=3393358 RepID=UPI00398F912F